MYTIKDLIELVSRSVNILLPKRSNFEIVETLKPEDIYKLRRNDKKLENWITSIFSYSDHKVRAIIWELKYKNNTRHIDTISKIIYEEILAIMSDILIFDPNAIFLLIPIPITTKSRIERGYNQTEIIAKSILENDINRNLIYAPQWLSKTKETPKQSHTDSKEERQKNLNNSFNANNEVLGKYVFLIDDVTTTGSTLIEAKKSLIHNGAIEIYGFTIAH